MAHPFEVRKEIEVDATPEAIWEAIATASGIDGWFVGGHNQVDGRLGGSVRYDFGDDSGDSTITAWDPPHHFAHASEPAPDGSLHAFEYVIEGRGGGRALVRLVHSGFLAEDWESEYDALNEGDFMYLHLMAQYVTHFRGRRPGLVSLWRPQADRERALATIARELGLSASVAEGDRVAAAPKELDPIEGVVDFVSRSIVGVRTDDALYRFLHSPQGVIYIGHHLYRDDIDITATRQAWQGWLERAFA
jgi:uncharacterized protein YndB with AHSA1/START domain